VDWEEWRLLTSKLLSIPSPAHLDSHWDFMDGVNAHEVLDAIERAEMELAQRR